MDTANSSNQSFISKDDDQTSEASVRLNSNVPFRSNDVSEKNPSDIAHTSALCVSETDQKVVVFGVMKLCNDNVAVAASSPNDKSNYENNTSNAKTSSMRTPSQSSDYVNFSNSRSFLKVDLKSAIYSRGYLSIWVKITYRIYEKISDTDWIGLYYLGKC